MQSAKLATAFNLISAIVALGVQMAVSFFLSSYLVATLGEAANGFTQLANNFVSYASLITLAFNSMGSRFISSSYHRGKVNDSIAYYSTLVVVNSMLCLVFLPVAVGIVVNLQSIVDMGDASVVDVQMLFAFVFANFGANLFVGLFCSAMFVTNKIYIQNAINLIRNVLNAVLLLTAYGIFESRVSYVSLISLALTLVCIPVCFYFKRRLVPELKFTPSVFSSKYVRSLTSSGMWNSINQCGSVLTSGLDLLFANWFVGASPMGVLSVAKTIPSAIITLATTLNNNLEPELVIIYAKEGVAGLTRRLRLDMRISNLIVSAPIGVFCALAPAFYSLWMPTLEAGELTILSILSVMNFIPWAGPQVLYNVFTVMNRLRLNSLTFLAGSVVNVATVLLLLCFTNAGIYAIAGVSAAISILRNLAFTAPYVARLLEMPWYSFYREMGISTLSCGFAAGISFLVGSVLGTSSWLLLFISIFVSCALAWIVLYFTTVPKEARKRLALMIRR